MGGVQGCGSQVQALSPLWGPGCETGYLDGVVKRNWGLTLGFGTVSPCWGPKRKRGLEVGSQQGWGETGPVLTMHSLRRTAASQAWGATYVAAKVKVLNMTWVIALSLALELTGALMSTVCTPPRPHMACCRSCDGTASVLPADDDVVFHPGT